MTREEEDRALEAGLAKLSELLEESLARVEHEREILSCAGFVYDPEYQCWERGRTSISTDWIVDHTLEELRVAVAP